MIVARIIVINEMDKNISFARIEIEKKSARRLVVCSDGYIKSIESVENDEINSLLSSPETMIRIGVTE